MGWSLAADAVLVIHLAFVVFIVIGAVAARWFRWVVRSHLAALTYGAAIQAIGFTCPLTPLEKSLRRAAGETAYDGGFIGHYITPVLYPGELTFVVKSVMVLAIAVVNVAIYAWLLSTVIPERGSPPSRLRSRASTGRSLTSLPVWLRGQGTTRTS